MCFPKHICYNYLQLLRGQRGLREYYYWGGGCVVDTTDAINEIYWIIIMMSGQFNWTTPSSKNMSFYNF